MGLTRSSCLFALLLASGVAAAQTPESETIPPLTQTRWSTYQRSVEQGTAAPEARRPEPLPTSGPTHLIAPFVWGCEDEWRLQVGGDVAFRGERRRNYDMNSHVKDNDTLSFLRTRVSFDLNYCDTQRFFLEFIDAHAYNYRTDPFQSDEWDVFQAFAEFRDRPKSPWAFRIGRQLLPAVGEARIFGVPPSVDLYWANLLRTFDGGMLEYKDQDMEIYTFLLQPTYYQTIWHDRVVSDRARNQERTWFYGTYALFKCFKPHEFDVYFFGLTDRDDDRDWPVAVRDELGNFGTSDRYTVGTRWRGAIHKWEGCGTLGYGLEGAYQFGNIGDDEISAHMLHADVNYTWEAPWKPKVTLLGNLASGDDELGDGENNTFNPLYGASHYAYGTIDFVRLQNLREIALTASVEPTSKLKVQLGLHRFWMDSPTDAWVTAMGTSFGRDPSGQSGRELGEEIDLTAYYKVNANLSFETGVAHFFPGEWANKNGRDDGANFLFLQTVYKF